MQLRPQHTHSTCVAVSSLGRRAEAPHHDGQVGGADRDDVPPVAREAREADVRGDAGAEVRLGEGGSRRRRGRAQRRECDGWPAPSVLH